MNQLLSQTLTNSMEQTVLQKTVKKFPPFMKPIDSLPCSKSQPLVPIKRQI